MASPYAFLGLNLVGMQSPMPPPPGPGGLIGSLPPSMMDPSLNNSPLEFNSNKNKPPMPKSAEEFNKEGINLSNSGGSGMGMNFLGDTDSRPYQTGISHIDMNQQSGQSSIGGMEGHGDMMSGNMMMGGPMSWGPMSGDPNMMMMGPMTGFSQGFGWGPTMSGPSTQPSVPQKELITLKSCTLIPPPPGAPPPTTRDLPPGCRTIFVGGLPDTCTEEILREIFDKCGPIISVRLSKKNFSHIRFEFEEAIERAVYLSGYRIRIGNKDDKANTGRLHVDYAQARDDQYEFECKQRAWQREQRHRQRVAEERLRPPSPPPIIHYSEHEAQLLSEKLKVDQTFMKAAQVLVTWLDRGDCNKRSANSFYSLVQSSNSHVRRLLTEKQQHEEEVQKAKEKFRQRLEGILRQFDQIDKVFNASTKQKAWDHFTKAQRKNIELWKKQCQEIRISEQEEFLKDREEDEMEMSDDEGGGPAKKPKTMQDAVNFAKEQAELNKIREENDALKCQLDAYKNEVDLLKQEQSTTNEDSDKRLKALQQALQGMQQQLIASKKEARQNQAKEEQTQHEDRTDSQPSSSTSIMTEREAKLIGLMSTFLHVHPFGASVDYIWSFLQRCTVNIRSSEIEDILEKLPSVFKQDLHGVGASLEKRWRFVGFDS